MSIFDRIHEPKFLSLLERNVRAMERIADSLETLLPSPLTEQRFKSNDLRPKGVESLKIYGEREAYLDEQRELRSHLLDEDDE